VIHVKKVESVREDSMKQNITLSLDKELIQKARLLAVKRRISVSGMLGKELERLVEEAERYEISRRKAVATLEKGFPLGGIKVSREDLHER
jgi:hypothetical protein